MRLSKTDIITGLALLSFLFAIPSINRHFKVNNEGCPKGCEKKATAISGAKPVCACWQGNSWVMSDSNPE